MRYLPIPLAFAALLLLPGSPRTGVAQDPDVREGRTGVTDSGALRKELEVMRRVLARKVSASAESNLYVHFNVAEYSSSSAFYVLGDGATFLMNVNLPVAPSGAAPVESDKEPTLWDEVLADVEGRPNPRTTGKKKYVYEAVKVKELEDLVLGALGRYGANLAQVATDEMLTVILNGPARHGSDPLTATTVTSRNGQQVVWAARRGHRSTVGTVLTIRVRRSDCVARAAGRLDAEEFRARATLHRY